MNEGLNDNIRRVSSTQDFLDAKNYVFALAQSLCLDELERSSLTKALNDVENQLMSEGDSNKKIIELMLTTLLDGLKYGNWPWVMNGLNLFGLDKRPSLLQEFPEPKFMKPKFTKDLGIIEYKK